MNIWLSFFLQYAAATNYYLDQSTDNSGTDGLTVATAFSDAKDAFKELSAGDTLYIKGEYHNPSYDPSYSYNDDIYDPHIWHAENSLRINNLHGNVSNPITITAYDSNTVIKGDGANIVRISGSSHLRIVGLEIEGQVNSIPLSTALALQFLYRNATDHVVYRVEPGTSDAEIENTTFPLLGSVPRPSYTDTRGFYMSGSQYVEVLDNLIHHVPGNGLRISESEFVTVEGNEVHDCSRRSYSGTHGLVVTKTMDVESPQSQWGDYRIRIVRNHIRHNYNEIYSWAPTKTIITPHIDEGKGVSLQRNQEFVNGGRILVASNIAEYNGFSGIHSNDGDNVDFFGNTAYANSASNAGRNIGISMSDGTGCRIINNIAVIDGSFGGFPISITDAMEGNVIISHNLVWEINGLSLTLDGNIDVAATNQITADPQFINSPPQSTSDYQVVEMSEAVAAGLDISSFAGIYGQDFIEDDRNLVAPTIGAREVPYVAPNANGTVSVAYDMVESTSLKLLSYTNPWTNAFSSDADGFQKYSRMDSSVPPVLLDDTNNPAITGVCNRGIVPHGDNNDFFGIADTINNQNPSGPVYATWEFDITNVTNLAFSVDAAAMGRFETSGDADYFRWTVQVDGGMEQEVLYGVADDSTGQSYSMADGVTRTVLPSPLSVNGAKLSNSFQTFQVPISGTGGTVSVTLEAVVAQNNEAVAFRNLRILNLSR